MTTEATHKPLIAHFASKLRDDREEIYRYDPTRQQSQRWDGTQWVDAAKGPRAETRMTKVNQETADDC